MPRDTDSLTRLLTDAYLKDGLDDEMSRARRFGRELGLLLFEPILPPQCRADMMYQVLKRLAKICLDSTRQVDTGVRWGNQVLLVLPETSEEGVGITARKIGEQFAEHEFVHPSTGEKFQGRVRHAIRVFPGKVDDREVLLRDLRDNLEELDIPDKTEAE